MFFDFGAMIKVMLKRVESGVSGKGLGPDFLEGVRDLALSYGLVGIAFTRDDGSIKVIAEGEEKKLEKFVKKLHKRQFFSSIENTYALWREPTGEFQDFSCHGVGVE